MRNHLLSQHFLRSPHLALILIGHSNLKKHDLVIEIGAGSGVITSALSKRVRKVIAIEPDHKTAAKLRENLAKRAIANVEVVEKDFLNYELPDEPYKVFSNPPFHLSSAIIHRLIESSNPPEAFYLILQKQFALKLLNTNRHYTSQLGHKLIQKYQTKIRLPLKNTDFTPPPAVPTVFFEAKKITTTDEQIIKTLNSDQVATVPTETVEGYAAALKSKTAILSLMAKKDRDFNSGKIFTLVPESIASISKYAIIPDSAKPFIDKYLPGELTLILPKNPNFHHFYYDHYDTIGIRIPSHPLFPSIAREVGPILLTSANPRGGTPKSTTGHLPSTIIDFTKTTPKIIRQGNLMV